MRQSTVNPVVQPIEIVETQPYPLYAHLFGKFFVVFLQTWVLMMCLGHLHGVRHWIPALGYWDTFVGLVALGTVGHFWGRSHAQRLVRVPDFRR